MQQVNFEELQADFGDMALTVIGYPDNQEEEAYRAMSTELRGYHQWWAGAFPQSQEDETAIRNAVRAYAHGMPLPELTLAQRGRLAIRLRLASRILRTYGSKYTNRPAEGWFPAKLYSLSKSGLIEWLLLDGTEFLLEVFDETILWAEEFGL